MKKKLLALLTTVCMVFGMVIPGLTVSADSTAVDYLASTNNVTVVEKNSKTYVYDGYLTLAQVNNKTIGEAAAEVTNKTIQLNSASVAEDRIFTMYSGKLSTIIGYDVSAGKTAKLDIQGGTITGSVQAYSNAGNTNVIIGRGVKCIKADSSIAEITFNNNIFGSTSITFDKPDGSIKYTVRRNETAGSTPTNITVLNGTADVDLVPGGSDPAKKMNISLDNGALKSAVNINSLSQLYLRTGSSILISGLPKDTSFDATHIGFGRMDVAWQNGNDTVGNFKITARRSTDGVKNVTTSNGITFAVNFEGANYNPGNSGPIWTPSYTTGWVSSPQGWWYRDSNGSYPANTWRSINGAWYHFNSSGYMQTGWLNLGGTWYYLNANGAMATGWINLGGTWYYLTGNGSMATGWVNLGGTWYYLRANGAMATGWINLGGTYYYLNSNGAMLANTTTPDGYRLGASGAWIR